MSALCLYDSYSRRKGAFEPGDPERVTMYVCGPTVYAPAHVGNFRPAVVFDLLFRLLRARYGEGAVVYARNFTDVDDKINAAAADQGVPISAITEAFIDLYRSDSAALNVLAPTLEPAATAHMPGIIALMERLVEAGAAYAAEGHVLFSVKAFEAYGSLSRRPMDEMIAGARVDVAPYKRDPADFVLWKPSKPGDPVWESPFGPGRPGWHIECSAMIKADLGETIDIHGGGSDLLFPHHENEIAQSVCAHGGAPLARFWMHNGLLSLEEGKMSKSGGRIVKVHDLLDQGVPGEAIRFALLSGHYRAPLEWSDALLERARKSLDRLYGALRRLCDVRAAETGVPEPVQAALDDDLNTPKAFAALFNLAGEANKAEGEAARAEAKGALLAAGGLMGFLEAEPDAWFGLTGLEPEARAEVDALVAEREAARKAKDFAKADALREALTAKGVSIDDGPEGSTWRLNASDSTRSPARRP